MERNFKNLTVQNEEMFDSYDKQFKKVQALVNDLDT